MKIPLKMQKGKLLGFYGCRWMWLFAMVMSVQALCAQTQKITGTVFDATGETLPGANVTVVGTSTGTMTDLDGKFTIQAPTDAILKVSFTGYITQNVRVAGKTQLTVTLQEDRKVLDEVVVTALGITREAKSLSYSRQAIDTESMAEVRASNMLDMLSGKAAGMQVIPGGGPLASTRIVIRGNNSLTGNNQPLFVIDGIPILNTEMNSETELDYGNPANTISPDEIENIEVLKGANAAALYGSDAANGVVLITTKKATKKDGLGISYGYNMMFGTLYNYPTYQNIYGSGSGSSFQTSGVNQYDLSNKGWTYSRDLPYGIWSPAAAGANQRSWGLPMLGFDIVGRNGEVRPYSPHPENVRDMFHTSTAITNSFSVDKLTDMASFRFSYTNIHGDDVINGLNNLNRHNFNLRATAKLSSFVDVDANVRYVNEAVDNRNYRGDASTRNPFRMLMNMPRDIATDELIPWKRADGMSYTYEGFMNPYWALKEIENGDDKHNVMGNLTFNIKLPYNLSLRVRAATEIHANKGWQFSNLGSSDSGGDGYYQKWSELRRNNNGDLLLSYNKRFGKNVSLSANLGANIQHIRNEKLEAWVDALKYFDWKSLNNKQSVSFSRSNMDSKEKQGIFGMASLGLYDWFFLEATMRNEWSSSLPMQNNSYLYYSVGTSLVLSDLLKVDRQLLSFAKVRASFAQVGNDTGFDQLRMGYTSPTTTYKGITYLEGVRTRPNPNLRPEITQSFEVGADLRFLDNRLALDLTYYSKRTVDQITTADASYANGFEREVVNAGEVRNHGYEISINYTPVKTNTISWTTTLNWAQNVSKIVWLPGGVNFDRGNGENGLQTTSIEGHPFAIFFGTDYKYAPDGSVRVALDGRPVENLTKQILGTIEPAGIGGWKNSVRVGQFDFGVMFDFQVGGKVWSQTAFRAGIDGETVQSLDGRIERIWSQWVLGENNEERRGMLQSANTVVPGSTPTPTLANPNYVLYPDWQRPKGVQQGNAVYDTGVDYFGQQVDADGNPIWIPSIAWVNPDDYWTHGAKRNANYIYDASYVKWRELSIGYNVPAKVLKSTPIRSARVSLVGRNLAIIYQATPRGLDPQATSTTGNTQGLEKGFNLPQANYGFDIKVTF